MNNYQKINLASQIVTRHHILLIRRIFLESLPDGEAAFNAFWEAERANKAVHYLKEQASYFPEKRRLALAKYYDVQSKLQMMMVQRGAEIFTAFPSRLTEYQKAEKKGILAELDFVKNALEHSNFVHRNTILSTFADELKLYHENADLIIGLHPGWREDEALADFVEEMDTMRSLPYDPDDYDKTDLAYLVLRQISPKKDGSWLNIPEHEHDQLMRLLQKEVAFLIHTDDELSEAQRKKLFSDNAALLHYLINTVEPVNLAFIALVYETIPPENRLTLEFSPNLLQLGGQYAHLDELTEADHEAIFRLFEYLSKIWEPNEAALTQLFGKDALYFIKKAWEQLAKASEALWEWETALDCYKKIAKFSIRTGNIARADKALFEAVEALKSGSLQQEALTLIRQILQKDGKLLQSWGFPDDFSISKDTRAALESSMVSLLDELGLSDQEVKNDLSLLQSDANKHLARFHLDGETDTLSSEDLQRTVDSLNHFYGLEGNQDTVPDQDRVKNMLLYQLNETLDTPAFKNLLSEIEPHVLQLSDDLQLLYQLNVAKLQYLQGDSACIAAFKKLLPNMAQWPSRFDESLQAHWLNNMVRAYRLVLAVEPARVNELGNYALKALNIMLKGYVAAQRDRSSMNALMNEIEALLKVLLLNEQQVQADLGCSQTLLQMVWNVLSFRREFLNLYLGKRKVEIAHESRYVEQISALRKSIYAYLKNSSESESNEMWKKVGEFRSNEFPFWHKSLEKNKWADPVGPSLALYFFSKNGEKRTVMMLSFQPEGHAVPMEQYLYAIRAVPPLVEAFVTSGSSDFGNITADPYHSRGLDLKEEGEEANGNLFAPGWENAFNQLFGDFLTGGEALYSQSRQQYNLLAPPALPLTPRLNLYCDHFLQLLPIELLSKNPATQLGLHSNFSIVLQRAYNPELINWGYDVVCLSSDPGKTDLPPLPGAEKEIESIQAILSAVGVRVRHLKGMNATRANLEKALKAYPAIVHFAVHGLADTNLPPETSSLVLSPDGEDESSCLLTYQDILLMDWSSVKLVVLSACNSSVGKVRKGSPIQGLAYAFLSKGVQCVVASRSPVSDQSSAKIMNKFYQYLLHTDVTDAMRLTRRWFTENQDRDVSAKDLAAWGIWS